MEVIVQNWDGFFNVLLEKSNVISATFYQSEPVQFILGVVIGVGLGSGVVLGWR